MHFQTKIHHLETKIFFYGSFPEIFFFIRNSTTNINITDADIIKIA